MERDIVINGMNIHYDESGPEDAPAVILMHGWGCTFSTVSSIASCLSTGMHVYNMDLPGHGKSTEPDTVWGVGEYADLVEKFIDKLNIKNPALIGHSFGGRIAILLSSRRPIEKIMLVDAAGIKPRRSLKYYFKVYSFKAMKKLLPLILGKKKGEEAIEKMRGKAGSADYRQSSPMMRAVMSRCVNQDLKKYMPSIKASTLLIWGENDTATPLSDAKTMERLIPDAGLVSFAGCGHYSFLDNPYGFKSVAREFFKKELAHIANN
ncbi:MAG: alpha/beta hydrolase [Clostridium sp.]|nr:alpha/beta hydrolase [Prevotella sp.]MCM1429290.1 alpha/beta hydrolase [Clostridium sp.]